MIESLINVAIFGFATGFVFSIPAAGPVMIIIMSNGLKGKLRFCQRVTYGAALADWVYAFVGVYAFARLYDLYAPYIPYILAVGSLFLVILGLRIMRTHIDFEHMDDSEILTDKLRNKGGFRIGLAINFLNPALFVGWLASSFVMLSLASVLGLHTGGLSMQMKHTLDGLEQEGVKQEIDQRTKMFNGVISHLDSLKSQPDAAPEATEEPQSVLFYSFLFAAMLALGSTAWFYILTNLIVKYRRKLNMNTIRGTIKFLGAAMLAGGAFFALKSVYELLLK